MQPITRKRKLILPGLQLYLTLSFLGMSVLALLFQFVVFANTAANAASALPNDADLFLGSFTSILVRTFLISTCVVLPLTVGVGILITNRVAGPVYRFQQHLQALVEHGESGPCRIRTGDQLQELCELINRTTEALAARKPDADDQRLVA